MAKTAVITGVTGQDGSFLAELLLAKGYEVHGIVRRVALEDPSHRMWRIQHVLDRVQLHAVSLENPTGIGLLFKQLKPDEIYHLAAQSFVAYPPDDELFTLQTNIVSTYAVLSACREASPAARLYFAGSSEMFGRAVTAPQTEETPFRPRSAYGISKCTGYHLARNYRETYGLFASAGILFNHESPRRGFEFVTRKISRTAALIASGKAQKVRLGNLDARRDWGHAQRYVEAIWSMLQVDEPQDFVIATGETHSVREFCELAFKMVGRDYREHVETDPALFRPTEDVPLVGDTAKAKRVLGWTYRVPFEELVREMVESDLERVRLGADAASAIGVG